jgi:hypothetical protein
MKIKYKDFILQPGMYAKERWDVIKTVPVTMSSLPNMKSKYPKAKNGDIVGTREIDLGYDLHLENAISKIISYLLADNDSITDLKGFLKEYSSIKSEIENLVKI